MKTILALFGSAIVFIIFLFSGCKKKDSILPNTDISWKYVADGSGVSAKVFQNELYVRNNTTLFRIDADGNLIETRKIGNGGSDRVMLYNNFYLTTYFNYSNTVIGTDSTSIFLNSYKDVGNNLLLNNLQKNDSTFVTVAIFATPLDTITLPALLINNYTKHNSSNFIDTTNWDFLIINPNVDPSSGNITDVSIKIKINEIFRTTGSQIIPSYICGFKNNYIFTYNDNGLSSGYILNSSGTIEEVDNIFLPQFVYHDTLYATTSFPTNNLYSSVDGKDWNLVHTNSDYFGKMVVVNNHIVALSGLREYDIESNTFKSLNSDGLPIMHADFIMVFNDYVYISCYGKIYRNKVQNVF